MRKVFFVLVPALVIAALLYLGIQFIAGGGKKGALQVTAAPDAKVYLNNKYIGQTPLCKCDSQDMVSAGEYTLRLVPNDTDFAEFQEKITISEAVLTVVDRRFGRDSTSSGSVISLSKLDASEKTELLIVSIPSKSEIFLDNNKIGESPYLFKDPTESDHVLRIRKNGYEEKTIRIRTPKGYKLTVAAYLSTGNTSESSGQSSNKSDSVTPTPIATASKVTILETPTGFLRVRQDAASDSPEIARVTPNESFDLITEIEGWYQIKLSDGKSGWVSSEYAKKE